MSAQSPTDATESTFYHPDLFVVPSDGSKPYLLGYQCESCSKIWFPRVDMCPNCWSKTKQITLSRTGKLYSFTTIRVGPKTIKPPYVIGYIDLPENLRIFAQIAIAPEKVKIGMDLEVTDGVIRLDNNDKPVVSYKFKAID